MSSCSGGGSLGKLNLLGWLGGQGTQSQPTGGRGLAPRGGYPSDQDTRPLAGQIVGLARDRTPSGIILTATVRMPRPGYSGAELVFTGRDSNGLAQFDLRARAPGTGSPPAFQDIVVGHYLTWAQLNGIRRIQVQGASNSRSIRP